MPGGAAFGGQCLRPRPSCNLSCSVCGKPLSCDSTWPCAPWLSWKCCLPANRHALHGCPAETCLLPWTPRFLELRAQNFSGKTGRFSWPLQAELGGLREVPPPPCISVSSFANWGSQDLERTFWLWHPAVPSASPGDSEILNEILRNEGDCEILKTYSVIHTPCASVREEIPRSHKGPSGCRGEEVRVDGPPCLHPSILLCCSHASPRFQNGSPEQRLEILGGKWKDRQKVFYQRRARTALSNLTQCKCPS